MAGRRGSSPHEKGTDGLLHHHRREHPVRGSPDSDSDSDNNSYGAAQRDFRRRYGEGGAAPAKPPWKRAATFRDDGTGELQTYYQSLGAGAQGQLARRHKFSTQFLHLLGKVLLRWATSAVLAGAMVLAFYEYEKVRILDTKAKRWFNAVSTGLYLTLGLNLAASLKGMAIIIRWKLLARKKHRLEEVDFILGLSSLIKVFRYGIHVFGSRPGMSFACFGWILFNAVARLSVALTGLTYSYDSAGAVTLEPGLVNITNWASFSELDTVSRAATSTPGGERFTAHSYGLFSVMLQNQPLTEPGQSDPNQPLDWPIEIAPNGDWVYYFREFSPDPMANLGHKSERFVRVTADCEHFPLVEGQYGNSSTVAYTNGTEKITLDQIAEYGPAATTWANPRSDLPFNSEWNCGPRCATIFAFQFLDLEADPGPGSFFACHVNISQVQGGTVTAHALPDSVATIAAGSIGLEGYTTNPKSWEYVRYQPESAWSGYNVPKSTSYMGRLSSRFAVGAIAAKDLYGANAAQANGQLAVTGVLLRVKWPYLGLILGGILMVQLVMGLAAVVWANSVFCKDDSYLSTARLLRPVVERLGPSGCAMTGRDIAHTVDAEVMYGVRTDETGLRHHLDLGEDIQKIREFPEGWYDGYQEWVDVADSGARSSSGRGKRSSARERARVSGRQRVGGAAVARRRRRGVFLGRP